MNRLLVLLVASMLGIGCIVSDQCRRTVAIGWPSFRLADNTTPDTCSAAGANYVDVFIDDGFVAEIPCSEGGVNVIDVSDNSHLFTVEALDSGTGAIKLRDEFTIAGSCDDELVDTEPSEGTLLLDFSFSPDVCSSATDSYMWFSIHDDISNDTIIVDLNDTPKRYHCGNGSTTTPVPISFPLASGPYTFQRIEEVLYPGPSQEAGNCNAAEFDVFGGTQKTVGVALADGVSCF